MIEECKEEFDALDEAYDELNESKKLEFEHNTIKNCMKSILSCVRGGDDHVRDTKISLLMEAVKDEIKRSNEKVYDEGEKNDFPQDSDIILNLLEYVDKQKDFISQ